MSTRRGIKCLTCGDESNYFTTSESYVFALIRDFRVIEEVMVSESWDVFNFLIGNSEVYEALRFLNNHKGLGHNCVPVDQYGKVHED